MQPLLGGHCTHCRLSAVPLFLGIAIRVDDLAARLMRRST
jgi:hypothetical protein